MHHSFTKFHLETTSEVYIANYFLPHLFTTYEQNTKVAWMIGRPNVVYRKALRRLTSIATTTRYVLCFQETNGTQTVVLMSQFHTNLIKRNGVK